MTPSFEIRTSARGHRRCPRSPAPILCDHPTNSAQEPFCRLAVAQELSTDEPQVLILDDVLVDTDPVRQERILDVLGTQAARLQILILTCHPDRYRGVGQSITLTS